MVKLLGWQDGRSVYKYEGEELFTDAGCLYCLYETNYMHAYSINTNIEKTLSCGKVTKLKYKKDGIAIYTDMDIDEYCSAFSKWREKSGVWDYGSGGGIGAIVRGENIKDVEAKPINEKYSFAFERYKKWVASSIVDKIDMACTSLDCEMIRASIDYDSNAKKLLEEAIKERVFIGGAFDNHLWH